MEPKSKSRVVEIEDEAFPRVNVIATPPGEIVIQTPYLPVKYKERAEIESLFTDVAQLMLRGLGMSFDWKERLDPSQHVSGTSYPSRHYVITVTADNPKQRLKHWKNTLVILDTMLSGLKETAAEGENIRDLLKDLKEFFTMVDVINNTIASTLRNEPDVNIGRRNPGAGIGLEIANIMFANPEDSLETIVSEVFQSYNPEMKTDKPALFKLLVAETVGAIENHLKQQHRPGGKGRGAGLE